MRNTKNTPRLVAKGKGGAGGGIRMAICRADEDVAIIDDTFAATIITNLIGSASGSITAKNLDVGTVTDPTTSTTLISAGDENVFLLLDGMYFLAIECDDGQWQTIQAGGVFESTSGGGGPTPI